MIMKKPKIEKDYKVINALDMLGYVEEISQRKGLEHRIWGEWEFSNDSYCRPWNLNSELEDFTYGRTKEQAQETYDDLQAVLEHFPEMKDEKTLLWVCW